jgi:hypothetical protein
MATLGALCSERVDSTVRKCPTALYKCQRQRKQDNKLHSIVASERKTVEARTLGIIPGPSRRRATGYVTTHNEEISRNCPQCSMTRDLGSAASCYSVAGTRGSMLAASWHRVLCCRHVSFVYLFVCVYIYEFICKQCTSITVAMCTP